jgi:ABC-2 type transport system permease protein
VALTHAGRQGPDAGRPDAPAIRHFARLKLRMLGNGLRGQPWRVGLFVLGCLCGLAFAATGFVLFALPALGGRPDPDISITLLGLGGAIIVLGWLLLPLVFFGVDETLDPVRFALLPLPRRTLVTGLIVAGLVGIPAVATAGATAGTVVTAGAAGGVGAALAQAFGVAAGLLLCVTASRAITSGFAAILRSRRMRDLAAIMLALLAALLGPLQVAVISVARDADLAQIAAVGRVAGWTPFGAPYTVGLDLAAGRPLAAAVKLAGTVVLILALLWWWSRTLESAMVGTASIRGTRPRRAAAGGPVAQLFAGPVRWAPRNRYGALVAREVRYWWRDARRRAGLITIVVVGVFVPLMLNLGGPALADQEPNTSPVAVTMSMLFVGTLAALSLANQFGYDGSAFAAHLAVGVPGRIELTARLVAYSVYMVPILTGIAVLIALLLGRPVLLLPMLGGLAAAYGTGLAVNTVISVLGAYALPETSNPFAISAGGGAAKSLLSLVALVGSAVVAAPFLAGAALLGDVWTAVSVPVGLAYGFGSAALACYIAGDVLDHRAPELLRTVTPR